MVTEARSEFLLGLSCVGFGSALAIRGTVNGNPLVAIFGLGILAVVVPGEVTVSRKGALPRWARRVAIIPSLSRARTRTLFQVVLVVGAFGAAVRCVISAIDHDWEGSVYFAVIGAAGVGILVGILARPISAIGFEQGEAKVADPSNGPSDAP